LEGRSERDAVLPGQFDDSQAELFQLALAPDHHLCHGTRLGESDESRRSLELTTFTVKFTDNISGFDSCLIRGAAGFYRSDQRTVGVGQTERTGEFRIKD
jgi:hypothetical protein